MASFEFHKTVEKFLALKQLLLRGKEFGINPEQLLSKIDNIIDAMNDQTIRIVLLGSFSDGKTSAIAGLLGQLKKNMKIDQDESSDDLAIYHFDGIDNVEIIDTPGLFGTKEREINGENIRYSEITKRYISEANIIIYVCDAVTPLKESHVEIIKRVLREYGKLRSTIFVLNKMDEAGVDMIDEEDYERGATIKKNALIKRLEDTIGLSKEEADQLHIVCIAADPKGKGLEHWLAKMDSYKVRSRIGLLQNTISEIINASDVEELKSDTNFAVVTDIVSNTQEQLAEVICPLEKAMRDAETVSDDLQQDRIGLKRDLIAAKGRLLEDLHNLASSIRIDIDEASPDTIANLVENKLGLVDGQIDYNILNSIIEQTISRCVESNNYAISTRVQEYSEKMNLQGAIVKDALKAGAGKLGKVSVTNTQVLNVRNYLGQYFKWAKNIKFKPHGAGKLATKISKGAGIAGFAISAGLDIYSYIKEKKDAAKFIEFKNSLKSDVSAVFKELLEILNSEDRYFEEFAPSFIELCKAVEQRNNELAILQNQIRLIRQYNNQINDWLWSGLQNTAN